MINTGTEHYSIIRKMVVSGAADFMEKDGTATSNATNVMNEGGDSFNHRREAELFVYLG